MAEIVKKTSLDQPQGKGSAAGRGVIESEVFDASRKARTIVLDAQSRAEQVVLAAEQEAAKIRQAAHEQGFEEGKIEGLAKYEEAIVQLNHEYDEVLAQAEEQLLALSLGLAQKVIQRELVVNPKAILEIVRKAVQPMNRKKAISLRVNPLDREVLEKNRPELLEMMLSGGNVHLVFDPDISRGGCMVETEHGNVDARLETQLGILSKILTGSEAAVFAPVHVEEENHEQVISITPEEVSEPVPEYVEQVQEVVTDLPEEASEPEAFVEESLVEPQVAEQADLGDNHDDHFDATMVSEQESQVQEPVDIIEEVKSKFVQPVDEVQEDLNMDELLASLDKYIEDKE